MKIHSYFIVSALGLAMLNSCTDLAETPYTFVSPDTFYQNEKQLDEALMTEYSAFRNVAGNWQNIMRLEGCTEFAQPSRGPKDNNQNINDWYNVNSANSTGTFSNMWNRRYITITLYWSVEPGLPLMKVKRNRYLPKLASCAPIATIIW